MTPFYVFVLGTAIGSFLNVLIDRLPREEGITGRSYCDYCHEKLAPIDLIPVVSFLMLGGKCRRCGKKLSLFYSVGLYHNKRSFHKTSIHEALAKCKEVAFSTGFPFNAL